MVLAICGCESELHGKKGNDHVESTRKRESAVRGRDLRGAARVLEHLERAEIMLLQISPDFMVADQL
jgi:GTP cyclohydrolase II